MKKILSVVVMALLSVQLISAKDVVTSDTKRLPAQALAFIQQHFDESNISYIKIDRELFNNTYEVVLTNGMEIEFDNKGKCIAVDAKHSEVPKELVPEAIATYVKEKFSNQFITEIKHNRRGTKVELNNDLELIFDTRGNFMGLDD